MGTETLQPYEPPLSLEGKKSLLYLEAGILTAVVIAYIIAHITRVLRQEPALSSALTVDDTTYSDSDPALRQNPERPRVAPLEEIPAELHGEMRIDQGVQITDSAATVSLGIRPYEGSTHPPISVSGDSDSLTHHLTGFESSIIKIIWRGRNCAPESILLGLCNDRDKAARESKRAELEGLIKAGYIIKEGIFYRINPDYEPSADFEALKRKAEFKRKDY